MEHIPTSNYSHIMAEPVDSHAGHDMKSTVDDPHAGHDMGDGSSMSGGGHSMGMMMYFHISENSTILFKGWTTHNWQTMLGSCIAVFIMAALYEGLKVTRELLLNKYATAGLSNPYTRESRQPIAVPTTDNGTCGAQDDVRVRLSVGTRMCSISHLIQTLLHIIQVVLSYFIMLIFMTYNVYLCVAVALGAGAGYFLFSWKRSSIIDINEHCH